jgi:hypothetical protein
MAMNKIFAVVIALAAGTVFAKSNTCGTAGKLKKDLAIQFCAGATCKETDAFACCELDPTTCGSKSRYCGLEHFVDAAKAGNTAETNCCTAKTNCCTAKAACSTAYKALCSNGWKAKTGTKFCAGAECEVTDVEECCEADPTTCGLRVDDFKCDTGFVKDAKKAATFAGGDAAAMKTNCCTAKDTCVGFLKEATCAAGMKGNTAKLCAGNPCLASECCEADFNTCGGNADWQNGVDGANNMCDTGKFKDPAKAGTKMSTSLKTDCCTAQDTCVRFLKDATCAAGMKGNTAKLCAGNPCLASECCEADLNTCGGNADWQNGVGANDMCDTGKFKDPAKAGTKVSTSHKTDCCTAKATCETFSAGESVTTSSVKAQTPAMAFVFAVVGVLALLK